MLLGILIGGAVLWWLYKVGTKTIEDEPQEITDLANKIAHNAVIAPFNMGNDGWNACVKAARVILGYDDPPKQ